MRDKKVGRRCMFVCNTITILLYIIYMLEVLVMTVDGDPFTITFDGRLTGFYFLNGLQDPACCMNVSWDGKAQASVFCLPVDNLI